MASDIPPSLRYLKAASSRFSSFRGYLKRNSPNDVHSWKQWAGEKIKFRKGTSDGEAFHKETITLFPGWAARRYPCVASGNSGPEGTLTGCLRLGFSTKGQHTETFEVDVFISGFASSYRSLDMASRSQRAFLRLAKGKQS